MASLLIVIDVTRRDFLSIIFKLKGDVPKRVHSTYCCQVAEVGCPFLGRPLGILPLAPGGVGKIQEVLSPQVIRGLELVRAKEAIDKGLP